MKRKVTKKLLLNPMDYVDQNPRLKEFLYPLNKVLYLPKPHPKLGQNPQLHQVLRLPLQEAISLCEEQRDGEPDLVRDVLDYALEDFNGDWGKLAEDFAHNPTVTQAIKDEIKTRMEGQS